MKRIVEPEWLDELPPDAAAAAGSRNDLRRINVLMGHVRFMERLWRDAGMGRGIRRVVELGAGDGTFLLKLVRRFTPPVGSLTAVLVDRQKLLHPQIHDQFMALGWQIEVVTADVFEWLPTVKAEPGTGMMANLFLHHFQDDKLRRLFDHIRVKSTIFAACEPRRTGLSLRASRLLGLIGCGAVTRHDALVSVRGGFVGRELSALWPTEGKWRLKEREAGVFSHCFMAYMSNGFDAA
jgi:hypothetical protein